MFTHLTGRGRGPRKALLIYGLLVALLLTQSQPAWAGFPFTQSRRAINPSPTSTEGNACLAAEQSFELDLIQSLNSARQAKGRWPLQRSPALTQAAGTHAQDMRDNDFVGSTGSDGSSPADRAQRAGFQPYGWTSCFVGESLAVGYSTAQAVLEALMADPGNRANLLNSTYREIGVGYVAGGAWRHYWVIDLGAQPSVLPVFINHGAPLTYSTNVTVTLTDETVSSWGSVGRIQEVRLSNRPDFRGSEWQDWEMEKAWGLECAPPWGQVHAEYRDAEDRRVQASDEILCAIYTPPDFFDVSPSNWFSEAVTLLYQVGVVRGYPDGGFHPQAWASRAELAAMLVNSMGWPLVSPATPTFTDVPRTHWAYVYVETAREHGAVSGYPDGTFRPDDALTRAELAAIIATAQEWPPAEPLVPSFPDVLPSHWAYGYIEAICDHDLMSGYPDGTFRPDSLATRAEAAATLARLLLLQVDGTPEMLGDVGLPAGLQGKGQVVPPTLPQKVW